MTKFNDEVNDVTSFDEVRLNNINRELRNGIEDTAQTISNTDYFQISKAMANNAAVADYYTDNGAVNAYILDTVGSFQGLQSLIDGAKVRFRAGNANTTASTINVNGTGVKSITLADGTTALTGDEITIDKDTILRYDLANDKWLIEVTAVAVASGSEANLIINSQGLISQRGLTFDSSTIIANDDDTYLIDRMLLLSDGNDIVDVSQELTTVPIGSFSAIKFDQETANGKWGYVQILEARDAKSIIGDIASFSFKARKGGSNVTLETLRAAVVSWDGAEDAVTSDLVSAWNAAGVDPTLVANWTYENTPSDLVLTSSYQTFTIENISIDTGSTKNVAVFIWLDDTDATVADTAFITDIKLEKGIAATGYIPRPVQQEIDLCQRFYEKTYDINTTPGTVASVAPTVGSPIATFRGWQFFHTKKRTSPTMTVYSPDTGASGNLRDSTAALDVTITPDNANQGGARISATLGGIDKTVRWHTTAESEL